jgi:hypothetical protein
MRSLLFAALCAVLPLTADAQPAEEAEDAEAASDASTAQTEERRNRALVRQPQDLASLSGGLVGKKSAADIASQAFGGDAASGQGKKSASEIASQAFGGDGGGLSKYDLSSAMWTPSSPTCKVAYEAVRDAFIWEEARIKADYQSRIIQAEMKAQQKSVQYGGAPDMSEVNAIEAEFDAAQVALAQQAQAHLQVTQKNFCK